MKPVSGKRFAKILEKRSWVHLRSRGSHQTYRNQALNLTVTIPIHGNRDLKPGLQRTLMKQTGLTEQDL